MWGAISIRQCFYKAFLLNNEEFSTGNPDILCWMSELIWREFYKHILFAFPRLSKGQAFQEKTHQIKWLHNSNFINAWKEGKTGIPIVDAAMRQLNAIGWMHNRLRMIVAMFFSKNLFQDWRIGETFFMEKLIDGDLAANNGGWQWCASTGVDAAPYFRIFNPISQSQRFDKEGFFIKQYVPELVQMDAKNIHIPSNKTQHSLFDKLDYPPPIVDLNTSRKKAIEAFKKIK